MKRKNFIVHDIAGKILSTGSCLEDSFNAQAGGYENADVIEGVADQNTQKIVGGKVVNKTADEMVTPPIEVVPHDKQLVELTNGELEKILERLTVLEKG